VRNLTVSESNAAGVDLWNASESTIEDVQSFDNRGDGHGFVLDNTSDSTLKGIKCYGNAQNGLYLYYSDNNIIKDSDLYMNNWSGLELYHSNNNTINNVTSKKNNNTGLDIGYSDGNTIKNSRVMGSTAGDVFLGSSQSNHIYNNLFNSTYAPVIMPFMEGEGCANMWNTTRRTGERIIPPGVEFAGNFWAAPDGSGFSEVCDDTDADGFCDAAYYLGNGNIDYMPLSDGYIGCSLSGDTPPCGEVTIPEILNCIVKWSHGEAEISGVINLITVWARGT